MLLLQYENTTVLFCMIYYRFFKGLPVHLENSLDREKRKKKKKENSSDDVIIQIPKTVFLFFPG